MTRIVLVRGCLRILGNHAIEICQSRSRLQTCEQCIKLLGGESETAASNISRNILKILACKCNRKKKNESKRPQTQGIECQTVPTYCGTKYVPFSCLLINCFALFQRIAFSHAQIQITTERCWSCKREALSLS